MDMFWKVRRRRSRFVTIVRSFLVVGAAVGVPVGLEVLRRFVRRGAHASIGGHATVHSTPARKAGSRRRRAPVLERTA